MREDILSRHSMDDAHMFVTDDAYKKAVAELVGGKDTVKMAVAFWGKGAAAFTCAVGSGPRHDRDRP